MLILSMGLLLLFPLVVPAQDWQNICSPGVTFYKDSNFMVKAFRLDSLEILGINDTLFYSFLTLRDTNTNNPYFSDDCVDTTYGSIFGNRILKQVNNEIILFNRFSDSIKIQPSAALNETWAFFQLTGGDYIQAKVTSIGLTTVMGVQDSLKVITLQARDSTHQNIPHHLNGQEIWLYKYYGIGKILDLYNFPNDSSSYTLTGQTHLQLGDQDFGWREIFDFDIGDEFHYKGKHTSPYYYGFESIYNVLDKTIYENYDSITYTFEHCEYRFNPSGPGWLYIYDTITRTYNFIALDTNIWIDLMPDEFKRIDSSTWSNASVIYSSIDTSKMKRIKGRLLNKYNVYDDTCWFTLFWSGDSTEYAERIGQTRNKYAYYDFSKLVYYKKGSETWGTPVATDCATLVSVEDVPVPRLEISIYPNPASTHITIEIPYQGQLSVLNLQGQELIIHQIEEQKTRIDISTLPSGVYLVKVTGEKGVQVVKFVKQ